MLDRFRDIQEDVAIVRAPPVSFNMNSRANVQSDGLLGAIMQGAWVGMQLSTREGFEVKVTEVKPRSNQS